MDELGIDYSKEDAIVVKETFKRYLKTASTSALDERFMAMWIGAFKMLCSRELGIELPLEQAEKSMEQILTEAGYGF